jgi:hypothetical protein
VGGYEMKKRKGELDLDSVVAFFATAQDEGVNLIKDGK